MDSLDPWEDALKSYLGQLTPEERTICANVSSEDVLEDVK